MKRRVLAPNGRSSNAPAITVVGSGTGTATGTPPGMPEDHGDGGMLSNAPAFPKVGASREVKDITPLEKPGATGAKDQFTELPVLTVPPALVAMTLVPLRIALNVTLNLMGLVVSVPGLLTL